MSIADLRREYRLASLDAPDAAPLAPVEAIRTRYFAHFGAPDGLSSPIAAEFAALN